MATNVLYVVSGNTQQAGQAGNPFLPYTFSSALQVVTQSKGPVVLWLNDGNYSFCTSPTTISGQVSIYGANPTSVQLTLEGLNVPSGSFVAIFNVGLTTCRQTSAFLTGSGNISINNSIININNGQLMALSSALVTLNNCNINLTNCFSSYGSQVNASRGGLIASSCTFNLTYPGPLTLNSAMIGVAPGTGFSVLNSCRVIAKLSGGKYTVVAFYNVNTINTAFLEVHGTGAEGLIVYGVDIPMNTVASTHGGTGTSYINNITVRPEALAQVNSILNTTNYPIQVSNIAAPIQLLPYAGGVNPVVMPTEPTPTASVPAAPAVGKQPLRSALKQPVGQAVRQPVTTEQKLYPTEPHIVLDSGITDQIIPGQNTLAY